MDYLKEEILSYSQISRAVRNIPYAIISQYAKERLQKQQADDKILTYVVLADTERSKKNKSYKKQPYWFMAQHLPLIVQNMRSWLNDHVTYKVMLKEIGYDNKEYADDFIEYSKIQLQRQKTNLQEDEIILNLKKHHLQKEAYLFNLKNKEKIAKGFGDYLILKQLDQNKKTCAQDEKPNNSSKVLKQELEENKTYIEPCLTPDKTKSENPIGLKHVS